MVLEIKAAAKVGDSLGGIVEVIAYGVPVGLGSHVHWDRKLDGLLAGALMSIQAVKRSRSGTDSPRPPSAAVSRTTPSPWTTRSTKRRLHSAHRSRGGTEGDLFRRADHRQVAMKPLSTLNRPVLETRGRRDAREARLVQGTHRRDAVPALVS